LESLREVFGVLLLNAEMASPTKPSANRLHVVITASGHLGDVQPFIHIGIALKKKGHKVSIATELRWRDLVDSAGLDSRLLGGDPFGALYEPKYQEMLRQGSSRSLMMVNREWDARFDNKEIYNSYVVACSGADIIVSNDNSLMQSYCVSEYLQCDWLPVFLSPVLPTQEFPHWALEDGFSSYCCCLFKSCFNQWTYTTKAKRLWKSHRFSINAWRRDILGLPVLSDAKGVFAIIERMNPPVIMACSPLISGYFSRTPADYNSNILMYGFSFRSPRTTDQDMLGTNAELVEFIGQPADSRSSAGSNKPRIVYLGLGPMPAPNPSTLLQLAFNVCRDCRCKAVLTADWVGLYDDVESTNIIAQAKREGLFLVEKFVPHDWLFDRVACIVHHGGVSGLYSLLLSI
jgi:sterol 3beta-glucosyltransferase